MRSVLYRRWAPAESPVRVEFLPEILHTIRAEKRGGQDRGYLFGRRHGAEIRVEAAIRTPQTGDPRVAGLEPVGIYVVRPRGEVFLTDADLHQADRVPDGIALAVVGSRAGFFPREKSGTIRAVRSYEEFLVADAAPPAEAPEALTEPRMSKWWRHPAIPPVSLLKWAASIAILLGGPMLALAYFEPQVDKGPIEIVVREADGQLLVTWHPSEMPAGGHLEITEGDIETVVALSANGSGVTYHSQTGDVEFRVKAGTRAGRVHWRSAKRTASARLP